MRSIASLVFCLFLLAAPVAAAPMNTSTLPPVITDGLKAYKDTGPEEAVKAWIKGSPIDGSREALSQSNNLHQVQDFYGAYQDYDLVKIVTVSPRIMDVYLVLDFQKGPLFSKFVLYRTDQGWVLTSFNFNTKTDAVFPPDLQ